MGAGMKLPARQAPFCAPSAGISHERPHNKIILSQHKTFVSELASHLLSTANSHDPQVVTSQGRSALSRQWVKREEVALCAVSLVTPRFVGPGAEHSPPSPARSLPAEHQDFGGCSALQPTACTQAELAWHLQVELERVVCEEHRELCEDRDTPSLLASWLLPHCPTSR